MNENKESLDKQKNPYLVALLKKMCSMINVDYDTMDFKEDHWYEKYTWTQQQEDEYLVWMAEELFQNDAMREELLEDPAKNIINCFEASVHFIANYGWNTPEDIIDEIQENK